MFDKCRNPIRGLILVCGLAFLAGCAAGINTTSAGNSVAAVPSNLEATPGNARVTLAWTATNGATAYNVKRATSSAGPYSQLASPTSPAYTDTTVVNGTAYHYVVSSVDTTGESADSSPAMAVPEAPTVSPAVPTGLIATAGNAQVMLAWSASSGASSYNVKRSTVSGGPYTQLAAATSPSYTDATVANSVTYFYVVSSVNAAGESTDSSEASATPDPTIVTPAVPMNVAATAGNAQVVLQWSTSAGATAYHVKRAIASGGPYTQIAGPSAAAYTDSSVSSGTTYYYVVSAFDSVGESMNSSQVSARPVAPAASPAVPTGVSATAGNAQVALSWSSVSAATSYHVKRSAVSGGPYTQIGTPTAAAYTDASVSNGTTYFYVVTALDSSGESATSTQVSAQPSAPVAIPTAPTGVLASSGNAKVTLSWSASSGATTYHVKRSTTSGGAYSQVGAPTAVSFVDATVSNGTPYYYVVSAVDSAGESANSSQVSATPATPVSNPPPTTFGTWVNVTPSNANLTDNLDCNNFGIESVQADPAHPANMWGLFHCQGIWKSTDYGATWTGPINTGSNGATAGDCAGAVKIPPGSTAAIPVIYLSCIRGNGTGFWVSTDGGVSWTNHFVAPSGASRQDYYPPAVDPYDANHLVMAGHEMNYLVQSTDGGQTWTNIVMAGGMNQSGGTGEVSFIDTGSAATTRTTWLWIGQQIGGTYGTWRTANGGSSWVQVDKNEHPHGAEQIYQPDTSGIVYMAGAYSTLGWGVLRSTDYGQTWAHVGGTSNQTVVFGTSKNVYSMYGYPIGLGGTTDPSLEVAAQPGTGTWTTPGTPAAMTQGPSHIAVVNDGTHNIFVGAMFNSGIWRYIEP